MITDLESAVKHIPSQPTYAIRIDDPAIHFGVPELAQSQFYVCVRRYWFDDVTPEIRQYCDLMFNDDIASRILKDFSGYHERCSALLVHCRYGLSRSPAVAMALNDIFDLGQDTEEMKRQHYKYNPFVYEKLLETAQKTRIT